MTNPTAQPMINNTQNVPLNLSINLSFVRPVNAAEGAEEKTSYVLLEPSVIPTATEGKGINLAEYLSGAYRTFFVVIFTAAVVMVAWGGFQYLLSDVVTNKEAGRKKIMRAFYGMAIALVFFMILYLINPEILKFKIFDALQTPWANEHI